MSNKIRLLFFKSLLLCGFCALNSLETQAQSRIISIEAENTPIVEVLKMLEKESGYTFFYNDNVLDKSKTISVKAVKQDILSILEIVFKGTNISASIVGSNIVLSNIKEPEPKVEKAPEIPKDFKRVSGAILDKDGGPIIGAAVVSAIDNSNAVITDIDGKFSLMAKEGSVLIVSSLGFEATEIQVIGNTTDIIITLKDDIKMLDEVVVVGYGVQKRSDITGAISSVDAEKAKNTPTTSIAEMLRGSAPGIQVNLGSAAPGGTSRILIRGRRSLSGDNNPLYVVDGVPMSSIDDINSNNIASIEVLKDASSQSIYGARAANGVILVTTKRGQAGKVKVSYDGYAAVQTIDRNFEFYNGEEWAAYRHEAFYNAYGYFDVEDCFKGLMKESLESGNWVDWEKVMIKPAIQHKHDVLVQGGSDKTKFALGLGYYNQDGMVLNSGFERIQGRLNIDQKLSKTVSLGANISFSRGWTQTADGSFNSFVTMPPLAKIYEDDGKTLRKDVTEAGESHYNPLWNINNSSIKSISDRLLLNLFGDWKIWKGLSYRLNASMNMRRTQANSYLGLKHTTGMNTAGRASLSESMNSDYLLENILNFTHDFGEDHHFDATLMQSINQIHWKRIGISGTGFPNDALLYNAIASAIEFGKPDYQLAKRQMVSFLARARYNYKDRYLFTGALRVDGASVFGVNNKYGYFPSAAFAWRIDNESFMKNVNWISNLKLRLSWGQVGNQGVSPYTTLGLTDTYYYEFGDQVASGYLPAATLHNPNLKWETSTSTNIGLDFGFIQDRIHGSIELYNTETTDLLVTKTLNQALGFTGQLVNLGRVQNRGIEIALNTSPISTKNFSWDLDFSWARNINKIKEIDGTLDESGKPKNDVNNKWFIDSPISVYYDYKFDGIWQLTDDISKSHMPDSKPGAIRLVDTNGDGTLTEADRVIMKRDPDWIASFSTGLNYKGLSLSADLYVSYGGTLYNSYLTTYDTGGDLTGKRNGIRRNYWTTNNPSNEAPTPHMTQAPAYIGTLGYQNASFIRLRNVTLGYTFPQKLIRKILLQNMNLYFSCTNLWSYTRVLGYGPEQTPGDYPEPRTILLGLKLTF